MKRWINRTELSQVLTNLVLDAAFFTTKPAGEGTGLVLSVAYWIVRAGRGGTQVRSDVGHGVTFSVYIPILAG
jgi:signal transduction histidine kinase